MSMSNISMCSDHWSVRTETMKTIYDYINSEPTPEALPLIEQVVVDESFELDKILFKGQKIHLLFQAIKREIDTKFTDEKSGTITYLGYAVCIPCWWTNQRYPGELEGLIKRIYTIINREMPQFFEVSEKISNTIVNLGNKRGIAYFLATPLREPLTSDSTNLETKETGKNDPLIENREAVQVTQPLNSGISKLFDSEKKKIYRINGRVWTQETIDTPQSGYLNNYLNSIQGGSSSICEYSTPPRGDGKITYISIKNQKFYYPKEDRIANVQTFLVNANNKTLHYQKHSYDIKKTLNSFVEKGLLDKEVVDLFF